MRPSIMLPIARMVMDRVRVVEVGVYTHADSERFIFSGLSNHGGSLPTCAARY